MNEIMVPVNNKESVLLSNAFLAAQKINCNQFYLRNVCYSRKYDIFNADIAIQNPKCDVRDSYTKAANCFNSISKNEMNKFINDNMLDDCIYFNSDGKNIKITQY